MKNSDLRKPYAKKMIYNLQRMLCKTWQKLMKNFA